MRRLTLSALLAILCGLTVGAQQRSLTLNDIFGPGGGTRFSGKAVARLAFLDDPWLDDSHYLWPNNDANGSSWLKVEAISGKSEPFLDPVKVASALAKIPGVTAD